MYQTFNSSRRCSLPKASPLLFALLLMQVVNSLASPAGTCAGTPPVKDQPRQVALHGNSVAADLEGITGSAEEVFELAQSGRIDRIGKRLDGLRKSIALLPVLQDDAVSALQPQLRHTMGELEQAVVSKDRLEIMRFSNRISLIATTLSVPLKPCVPTEVSLLDYHARELAIWSEMKRIERLSNIVIRMHLAWQTLMPKLVDRNATRELRRFSDLMGHLEAAKSFDEYSRLSRQVASELDGMKLLFARAR